MKIIRNIPALAKLLGDVIYYNRYKKKIDKKEENIIIRVPFI